MKQTDGAWRELERGDADIEIDLGPFDWTLHRETWKSAHGPVLRTAWGSYAFRYAGMGKHLAAAEQWYRMNKARDFGEWKEAMQRHALPMFNTVYADRRHIYYVYNALLPLREKGWPTGHLPGNQSRYLPNGYLPYDKLPVVQDPPSGFVQNCNSSPFFTTRGEGNPAASELFRVLGVETRLTNRALRALELFGGKEPIGREEFLRAKFDIQYDPSSPLYSGVIKHLLEKLTARDAREKEGLDLLREWNREASETSRGAALGVLTLGPAGAAQELSEKPLPPEEAFRAAIAFLESHYGKLDVPLGTLQRLRRGKTDLPLSGGPDVLAATYSVTSGSKRVGTVGDSLIFEVEFGPESTVSWAISPYGSSNRTDSPHYADQAPYFVRHELRRHWRTEKELRAHLEREYHPGEELKKTGR